MRIPEKPLDEAEILKLFQSIDGIKKFNQNDFFNSYLSIINAEYLHWDELLVDNRFKGLDFKRLWIFAKLARMLNRRYIKLNGLTLQYVQIPQIEKTIHEIDVRMGGKIDLEDQVQVPEFKKKYFMINSLMEEAIASSQLEGAVTSREAAKKMLRENRKPGNISEQMIVNNYSTMIYIKNHAQPTQPLTLEFIKEIHKIITKNTFKNKKYEGAFRTDNNVKLFDNDGNVLYEPPNYSEINSLLEQTCNFINNTKIEGYYLHPFIKAITLHYMIGYTHPFNDGNGRTARALFYWYLISQKYDLVEYIAISTAIKKAQAQYARAYLYSETDNNDITYFIKFNLHALDAALTSFEQYVDKTKTENKKILEVIKQNPELNSRQASILNTLSKNEKSMTINEMQKTYGITYETARTDLLKLAKQGYLHAYKKEKKIIFMLDKNKLTENQKP
jgi:Fic family protein